MSKDEDNNQDVAKLIKNSIVEISDHALNLASDDEILGEIPFVKYITSINKVRDVYTARKIHKNVMSFLKALRQTDEEIVIEEENYEEFVDTLSLILIESEKPVKAQVIGNLVKSYAQREIDFTTFNHLCLIVHSASVPAIYNLALCANEEMLVAIDKLNESHTSQKTYGIAPNISTRIVGVTTVTPLLSSLGVIDQNDYLNGYGMALVKYGKMSEVESVRMDRFRGPKN